MVRIDKDYVFEGADGKASPSACPRHLVRPDVPCANRGVDRLRMDFNLLDLTPLSRQEEREDSPDGWPQTRRTCGGACTTSTRSPDDRALATLGAEFSLPPYQWWRLREEPEESP